MKIDKTKIWGSIWTTKTLLCTLYHIYNVFIFNMYFVLSLPCTFFVICTLSYLNNVLILNMYFALSLLCTLSHIYNVLILNMYFVLSFLCTFSLLCTLSYLNNVLILNMYFFFTTYFLFTMYFVSYLQCTRLKYVLCLFNVWVKKNTMESSDNLKITTLTPQRTSNMWCEHAFIKYI